MSEGVLIYNYKIMNVNIVIHYSQIYVSHNVIYISKCFTLTLFVISLRNCVIKSFCEFTVTRYYKEVPIGTNTHWKFYNVKPYL